eukprot:PITA_14722
MIDILSINIRGLGADPKFLALKDLFLSTNSKMLLIQETMHDSLQTITYFRRMFPSWHMVATNAVGLSSSLAVLWDPKWIKAVAFQCSAGILILAYIRDYPDPVHILNIYAPYKDCYPFWEYFVSSELLDIDSLLMGGDFNCTLCNDEIWGNGRKNDPIGRLIQDAIIQNNFVDVLPSCQGPTWDNGTWLADEQFNKFIMESWLPPSSWAHDQIRPFSDRLSSLRSKVKRWQREKDASNRMALKDICRNLEYLSTHFKHPNMSSCIRKKIWDLEKRKQKILAMEEASWRLKCRALWLREGDKNSKFFHRFANK